MQKLTITATEKRAVYQELLPQIQAVISHEEDMTANMANICAMLKTTFAWLWVGFYRVDSNAKQLVLGPFQGPLACTRIPYGKGVCGEVWANGQAQRVDDVNKHPNHIACSSLSRSEIVLPLYNKGKVIAVLDIDSEKIADFDETDEKHLTDLLKILCQHSAL